MNEQILLWLVSLAPSFTAVITSVICLVTWLKKFGDLKKDIKERVELDELKQKLEISLSESRELEKTLRETIEEYTKVKK